MADTTEVEKVLLEAIEVCAKAVIESHGVGPSANASAAARDLSKALVRVHGARDRRPGRVGSIG